MHNSLMSTAKFNIREAVTGRVPEKAMISRNQLRQNNKELHNEYGSFGALHENLNMSRNGSRFYQLIFVLRRAIFIIMVLFASAYPWL